MIDLTRFPLRFYIKCCLFPTCLYDFKILVINGISKDSVDSFYMDLNGSITSQCRRFENHVKVIDARIGARERPQDAARWQNLKKFWSNWKEFQSSLPEKTNQNVLTKFFVKDLIQSQELVKVNTNDSLGTERTHKIPSSNHRPLKKKKISSSCFKNDEKFKRAMCTY